MPSRSRWAANPTRTAAAVLATVAIGVGVGVLLTTANRSSASGVPTVGFGVARMTQVEGSTGPTVVQVPVALSATSGATITARVASTDGTATVAGADYVTVDRSVSFAPGTRTQTIPVTITGDTTLEDYQSFRLTLSAPSNASLGRSTMTITIVNDERPQMTVASVRVTKGSVAKFRPRLVQRYFRAVSASFATADDTARAGTDYTATTATVTVNPGSRTATAIDVPTAADAPAGTKTFRAAVTGADLLATSNTTATIVEPSCAPASGSSPQPVPAPASPGSPRTDTPPAGVTSGAQWDVVFQDDFADPAATASAWSNGMRDGSQVLEGNKELQWYSPSNSTVTTDQDGGRTISVLQQRLTASPVAGEYYPVGTLSRLYPISRCAALYDPNQLDRGARSKVQYQFRSGMLNSAKSFAFKYGYVEARVRMPKGFALWPALWLRDWQPWSYEIDAFEGFDRNARTIRSSYWWGDGSHFSTENNGGDLGISADGQPCRGLLPLPLSTTNSNECALADSIDLSAGYHTVGLNWTASKYEIYLDGVKRWTSPTGANVASAYNHLIINLAFGNNDSEFNWNRESVRPLDGGVLTSGQFPKPTIEWDFVRVWQAPGHRDTCTDGSC